LTFSFYFKKENDKSIVKPSEPKVSENRVNPIPTDMIV
jgi:hypothetical protein